MRRLVGSLIVLVAILSTTVWQGADVQAQRKKEPSLMRKKLQYSQGILEGIVNGDFEMIRRNAEDMQELGRSKEFSLLKSPEYRAQFLMFDFANGELIEQAKDKNLDGSALAHTQLTLSCVQCHKKLRAS
jgi:hypothetical protein